MKPFLIFSDHFCTFCVIKIPFFKPFSFSKYFIENLFLKLFRKSPNSFYKKECQWKLYYPNHPVNLFEKNNTNDFDKTGFFLFSYCFEIKYIISWTLDFNTIKQYNL